MTRNEKRRELVEAGGSTLQKIHGNCPEDWTDDKPLHDEYHATRIALNDFDDETKRLGLELPYTGKS